MIVNPIYNAVAAFVKIWGALPEPITSLVGLAVVLFAVGFLLHLLPR